MVVKNIRLGGSFRERGGSVFSRDDKIYRQVNLGYKQHYDLLMSSGLYNSLINKQWLIVHHEAGLKSPNKESYKIIKPDRIPFISYPYEWAFSQLKDAAILTLSILREALAFGMILKDASAFNNQFIGSKPIFIDTTSFKIYPGQGPWVGYRQFCQHFLAPLALMAYRDERTSKLLQTNIDGIPLDLAARLLPRQAKLKTGLLVHLFLHARLQQNYADKKVARERFAHSVGKDQLFGIIASLEKTVKKLAPPQQKTEWQDYYRGNCNYDDSSFSHKKEIISKFLQQAAPTIVWDLGANTGVFSDLASKLGAVTMAFDIDQRSVEINYRRLSQAGSSLQLPLVMDLTAPSPAIGWNNQERYSLKERGPADTVMALALIHHLAISNNVPLRNIAEFFSTLGRTLIIEFVPKEDTQVQKLLSSREDIFPEYNRTGFEEAFQDYFKIEDIIPVNDSYRVLYLMRKKKSHGKLLFFEDHKNAV